MATESRLRLSIRKDKDYRDVDIRLTFNALCLVVWLGLGIILLYEILCVLLLLVRKRLPGCRAAQEQGKSVLMWEDKTKAVPSVPLYVSMLWGISTAYGVFYSFEARKKNELDNYYF